MGIDFPHLRHARPAQGLSASAATSGLRSAVCSASVNGWRARGGVRVAFIGFAFSLPFEMLTLWERFTITKFLGFALALAVLTQPRDCLARMPRALGWFALYYGVGFSVSLVRYDNYPVESFAWLYTSYAQLFVMCCIGYNLCQDTRLATQAMLAYGAGCLVISGLTTLGIGATALGAGPIARASFAGQNPNGLGQTLAVGAIVFLNSAFQRGRAARGGRYVLPLLALPLLVTIIRTGSRSAMLGFAVGLLAIVPQRGTLRAKVRNMAASVVFAVAMIWLISTTTVARQRWDDLLSKGDTALHWEILVTAWTMFLDRPLAGWGELRNTEVLGSRMFDSGELVDTHNTALDVLTKAGLLGCVPFVFGCAQIFAAAWRGRNGDFATLPLALLGIAFVACTTGNAFASDKWFWYLVGFVLASGETSISLRTRLSFAPSTFLSS